MTLREALLKWTLRESMRRDPPPKTPPALPVQQPTDAKGPRCARQD